MLSLEMNGTQRVWTTNRFGTTEGGFEPLLAYFDPILASRRPTWAVLSSNAVLMYGYLRLWPVGNVLLEIMNFDLVVACLLLVASPPRPVKFC